MKKTILLCLGLFHAACLVAQDGNTMQNAIPVVHANDYRLEDQTTRWATFEGERGSCYQDNQENRWYYFTPNSTSSYIKITVGSSSQYTTLVLFEETSLGVYEEKACVNGHFSANSRVFTLHFDQLDPTKRYYFSINGRNRNFSLQIRDTKVGDNNFMSQESAIEVEHTDGYRLEGQTTIGATFEGEAGSCYQGGQQNRWYYFEPNSTSSYIKITVRSSSQYTTLVLFEETSPGVYEEKACVNGNFSANSRIFVLYYDQLDPTKRYYFSVNGLDRNFSLEITDTKAGDYNFAEGALEIPHQNNWYSGPNAYSTTGATKENSTHLPLCFGPNRWFQFEAVTSNIKIATTAKIRYSALGIVDKSFNILASACNDALVFGSHSYSLDYNGLNPGETY